MASLAARKAATRTAVEPRVTIGRRAHCFAVCHRVVPVLLSAVGALIVAVFDGVHASHRLLRPIQSISPFLPSGPYQTRHIFASTILRTLQPIRDGSRPYLAEVQKTVSYLCRSWDNFGCERDKGKTFLQEF